MKTEDKGRTAPAPIETEYQGYRFRSRLEARWAVFFQNLGLHWRYEIEGFYLPSGPYLPDFFISNGFGFYVEVKPHVSLSRAQHLCADLARATSVNCLLIEGEPWPNEYVALLFEASTGIEYKHVRFGECRKCEGEPWLFSADLASPLAPRSNCRSEVWPIEHTPYLIAAFKAARGARFEHGEVPA